MADLNLNFENDSTSEEWAPALANLSTPLLNSKLTTLRSQSSTLSSTLTAKLASSPSGQSLLHIGPSLSTLPPDLHSLLTAVTPMLEQVRQYEKHNQKELVRIVTAGKLIERECRRAEHSKDCTQILRDLVAVEKILEQDQKNSNSNFNANAKAYAKGSSSSEYNNSSNEEEKRDDYTNGNGNGEQQEQVVSSSDGNGNGNVVDKDTNENIQATNELNRMASLERVAYATLHLMHQLNSSSEQITSALQGHKTNANVNANANANANASNKKKGDSKSSKANANANGNGNGGTGTGTGTVIMLLPSMDTPLTQDTEKAQFLMKLAPRIRALEKNAFRSISQHLELILKRKLRMSRERERQRDNTQPNSNSENEKSSTSTSSGMNTNTNHPIEEDQRLLLGHLFRSFALLGRGSDAESMFASVAIMPIVRKKISIGKLDEGGSRGECAGLSPLLKEIVSDIKDLWGDVLQLVESIFDMSMEMEHYNKDIHIHYLSTNTTKGGLARTSDSDKSKIDLVTAGVWVPIARALMTDPAIKTAIFSPGIASIFQANYSVLEKFLSQLSFNLLKPSSSESIEEKESGVETADSTFGGDEDKLALTELYYEPDIDTNLIRVAQARIYGHGTTVEFSKKWNLPIYYQLRFGEVCARLEKAIQQVESDGWHAEVYSGSGSDEVVHSLTKNYGFELPFFMEVFDTLRWLWGPEVFLKPLTHRFLRGTIQILGRVISFIKDGLEGKIKFGSEAAPSSSSIDGASESALGTGEDTSLSTTMPKIDRSYCWNERIEDVASVSWELTILETYLKEEHVQNVLKTLNSSGPEHLGGDEMSSLIGEVMVEAAQDISPVVDTVWNEIIVNILTAKCTAPLSAVKGVAATYRMTNRPPPTQASPFVGTILRSLQEFDTTFSSRTPSYLGTLWKKTIVDTIADLYSTAVAELIETVQRTEEALKNRKVRRAAAGGMSDGEKVRLQLFLDQQAFSRSIEDVGIDPSSIDGMKKLISLTKATEELYLKTISS
uniref:COG complex component COG2 C-terminal domain-containing protein n=1 Tax=Chaetoceros debilis TaxID=122233 RepID=A0A7S3V8Q4_9STRA